MGLFCRPLLAKNPNFCLFWTSTFSVVANWRKLNTGAQLPIGIKIVSLLQRLHGEIGRTISDVQKRDEQADKQAHKQTKNSTFLATPAAGEIRAPTNLA